MNKYFILPFQFKYISNEEVLLVNECGDYCFISSDVFDRFIRHELNEKENHFYKLKSHLLLAQNELEVSLKKIAARYRTRKSFLRDFTTLHMMVITLRCNQHCKYCQVSCADEDAHLYDMSKDVALRVVDMIFSSPSKSLKIEFQGGEPLLNWSVIEETVKYAEKCAENKFKNVEFVICTNLTIVNEEQLCFCRDHGISISTSFDGPKYIHDACRKMKSGSGTYDIFLKKLDITRGILGDDGVDALMTTSAMSLEKLQEVVDEYRIQGFNGIFIRSLNPYGFAAEHSYQLGYTQEDFAKQYLEVLGYIIKLNRSLFFPEHFATLLFSRVLTPFATGFVDLQSPSGAGISAVIYDYDGSVFPADEARMLARMGDRHFCLGNVKDNVYSEIFLGKKLREIVKKSCVEITPACSGCVYQAYCGTDPIRNYLECGDELRNMADTQFCIKHKMIFDGIFNILHQEDSVTKDIIWSWISRNQDLVNRHDYA